MPPVMAAQAVKDMHQLDANPRQAVVLSRSVLKGCQNPVDTPEKGQVPGEDKREAWC